MHFKQLFTTFRNTYSHYTFRVSFQNETYTIKKKEINPSYKMTAGMKCHYSLTITAMSHPEAGLYNVVLFWRIKYLHY